MAKSKLARTLGTGLLVGAAALMPLSKVEADDLAVYFLTASGVANYDVVDLIHTNVPYPGMLFLPVPYVPALEVYSQKDGINYAVDFRGTDDFSVFNLILSGNLGGSSITNADDQLAFYFADQQDPNRIYTARISCYGTYTLSGQSFNLVTNIAAGVYYVGLPGITNLPNGAVYGTIDVSCRFLTNALPTSISVNGTNATVQANVQSGATVTPQYRLDLTSSSWSNLTGMSRFVVPDANNFNAAPYDTNAPSVTISNLPAGGTNGFYRLMQSN